MRKCNAALPSVLMLAAISNGQVLPGFPFREDRPVTLTEFQAELERFPLDPVSDQDRQFLIEMLPKEGRVSKFNKAEREKLASLHTFLALTGRDAALEPIVIDVPQAFLGLHERAVLVISLPALRLLSKAELQALAAHEMGHSYAWPVYSAAKLRGDAATMRQVELWCDDFAVVMLLKAGLSPRNLVSGIRGITNFNAKQLGAALNEDDYPRIGNRLDRLKKTISWASGAGTSAAVTPPPVRTAERSSAQSPASLTRRAN